MNGTSYSHDVDVLIMPTFHPGERTIKLLGHTLSADPLSWIEPDVIRRDLLSVSVTNSLARGYGTFQIELAPRELTPGVTWEDVVTPYSLVSIAFHSYSSPLTRSSTTSPEPVMLGLVDRVLLSTDYASQQPRRTVVITGRSLTAVLVDHRWWYHTFLNASPNSSSNLPADFRDSFSKRPSQKLLRDEINLRALGFLSVDPNLFNSVATAHPVEALQKALDFFVGTPEKPGFIKVTLPGGAPLSSRLSFSAADARASFFDPGARLSYSSIPTRMPEANCWDLCRYFCEPPFTELFSDTYGKSVSDAHVLISARKPPWLGHIEYSGPGGQPSVGFSRSEPPGPHGSLFDFQYGPWDLFTDTVVVDELMGEPQIARGLDAGQGIFSAYEVYPRENPPAGNSFGDNVGWQAVIPPTFDEDPESPSFILRYGIRPLKLTTKYIPVRKPDGSTVLAAGEYGPRSVAYQALLRSWLHQVPNLWAGHLLLKGCTGVRVGKRLVVLDGKPARGARKAREYYVTSVTHSVSFERNAPFTTAVAVTRGRDVQIPE